MTGPLRVRVVLDTNVVLSALIFRTGQLAWLREAWQAGRIVPLVDRETTAELLRVLHYPKFRLTAAERESLLADFLPYAESVPAGAGNPAPAGLRDPSDSKFIDLAGCTAADALVTGDTDILDIRAQLGNTTILMPVEFRDWLMGREAQQHP